ncbi:MAG: hypothetical protein GKR96_10760 [Gammaproteobacteria bacterium]|nr:hypothetical protein [Gammaproteobacteria bacterium]
MKKTLLGLSTIGVLFLPTYSLSSETETAPEAEVTAPSYNTFTNEDLISRTNDTYLEAYNLFLSETRGLAKTAFLLDKAREERSSYIIGHAIDGIAFGASAAAQTDLSIEQTKTQADTAKEALDNHLAKTKLTQAEYDLMQMHVAQLTQTRSSLLSLRDTINSLQLPLLEIGLRLADGTLNQGQVPVELGVTNIQDQLAYVETGGAELQIQTLSAQQDLEEITAARDALVAKSPEFQTADNIAKNRLSEALKRERLLQEFAEYETETLLRTLEQMQGEMIGLRGTFQISANRYNRSSRKIDLIEKDITELEKPDVTLASGNTTNADELEQLLVKIEAFADYQNSNIGLLRSLRTSYSNLGKQSSIFQGDAAVLNDHVFKMQVPATIIANKIDSGEIDQSLSPNINIDALAETKKAAETAMENAANGTKLADIKIEEISEEISKSSNDRQEAQQRLVKLGIAVELANQAKQWSAEISDLPAAEVVARFTQTTEKQTSNVDAIKEANDAMTIAQEQAVVRQAEFESLLDPLLRSTQQDHASEQQAILKIVFVHGARATNTSR